MIQFIAPVRARAIFHRHHQGRFPERHRPRDLVVRICCCCSSTARSCSTWRSANFGRRWPESCDNDCARMIRKEFIQTLREPRMREHADFAAADSAAGFRICRESGRGHGAHRLDGPGPHAAEPRAAVRTSRAPGHFDDRAPLPPDENEMQDAARPRTRWTEWCACCPASRATWSAAAHTSVQVLLDGTNSNTASIVSRATRARPSPRYSQ